MTALFCVRPEHDRIAVHLIGPHDGRRVGPFLDGPHNPVATRSLTGFYRAVAGIPVDHALHRGVAGCQSRGVGVIEAPRGPRQREVGAYSRLNVDVGDRPLFAVGGWVCPVACRLDGVRPLDLDDANPEVSPVRVLGVRPEAAGDRGVGVPRRRCRRGRRCWCRCCRGRRRWCRCRRGCWGRRGGAGSADTAREDEHHRDRADLTRAHTRGVIPSIVVAHGFHDPPVGCSFTRRF